MSDQYLWDGTGEPDPDVARAERALAPLRTPLPPARLKPSRSSEAREMERERFTSDRWSAKALAERPARATIRFLAPALALAAAVVLMVAGTYYDGFLPGTAWEVSRLDGQPRIESAPLVGTGRLAVGQTLATDAESRARVDVSTIGQVTVDRNTRVRLVGTRTGRHELALARGTLHAFISAPPGQFIVNTPSSTATDLGCVYTLHVDEDGTGLLSVAAGWVAFEYKGRESFVPARASSRTDPEFGPGTPRYDDSDEAFKTALDEVDRADESSKKMAMTSAAALTFVLEHARPQDAMTLWHLIARVGPSDRPAVVDALDRRAPMPIGVTRDAVLALDRRALDLWWDSLGLRDATWWRKWKGPYPANP